MKSEWKKGKVSSTKDLEAQLMSAVDRKDRKRATSLLGKLHRKNVHEGLAIKTAKSLLFKRRRR